MSVCVFDTREIAIAAFVYFVLERIVANYCDGHICPSGILACCIHFIPHAVVVVVVVMMVLVGRDKQIRQTAENRNYFCQRTKVCNTFLC